MCVSSVAVVVTLVAGVRTSRAEFRDTTDNTGSLFAAATLSIGDQGGRLLIDVRGLEPTMLVEDCVRLRYGGDLEPATVGLYTETAERGGLAPYLLLRIEEGTTVPPGACSGFESTGVVFDGTAAELLARHRNAATAFSVWEGVEDGATRSYRVQVSVADDDRAQGLSTAFELIAEARP